MKYEHPNELLANPIGILLIDLLELASNITDTTILDSLIDPPEGLYLRGRLKPLLLVSDTYYPKSKFKIKEGIIKDFSSIIKIKDDIVDQEGVIVLSKSDLINKQNLFVSKPILPVMQINAIYSIIIDYLFKNCKYARGVKLTHISNLIKQEYKDIIDEEYFDNLLEETLDELYEFVRSSQWNIYFHRLNGTTLIIEKMIDWRIYSWTEIMYQKQQEESNDIY